MRQVDATEAVSLDAIVSNAVRNLTLQVGLRVPKWNAAIEKWVVDLHGRMGWNVNDPGTTYPGTRFRVVCFPHDDGTPSLGHLAILMVSIAAVLAWQRRARPAAVFVIVPLTAFLFLCVLFKWQPWHARLHLPIYCLAAPIVGAAFSLTPIRFAAGPAALILVAAALPPLLTNHRRPLIGESSVFLTPLHRTTFGEYHHLSEHAEGAGDILRSLGARRIGIHGNHWLYALMRPLLSGEGERPQFVWFNPRFAPGAPDSRQPPDAVVAIRGSETEPAAADLVDSGSKAVYRQVATSGIYVIYARDTDVPAPP
jgi:hypothetical protein